MIKFEKRRLKTKLKNPLKNFAIDKQEIEFRKDPLTGRWTRVNINRVKRPHPGLGKDGWVERQAIKLSKAKCPFCSNNIKNSTAKFVGIKERFQKGESVLFSNIYPYSVYHGVAVLTAKKHFIDLNEMKPKLLFDTFVNCLDFLKTANRKNPKFKYPSINFNFMPPAAASIVHPHFQIILDDKPTWFSSSLLKNSLAYYKKFKRNFWLDLIKTEKRKKERFIGRTGSFSWLADFAPIKNNQVAGISEKVSTITSLKKNDIKGLANGLSKIFKGLWKKGIRSLTMSMFSGPIGKDISKHFLVNLKIVSRPSLVENYVSDIGFMELIHQESVIETLPEDVAKSLMFT